MSQLILDILKIKGERFSNNDEKKWHVGMSYPFACFILEEKSILFTKYMDAYTKVLQNPDEVAYKVNLDSIANQMKHKIQQAVWKLNKTTLPVDTREQDKFEHMPKSAFGYFE